MAKHFREHIVYIDYVILTCMEIGLFSHVFT